MSRSARKKSSSGIYHVMLRGINKQTIFEDDEDNERFLYTLAETRKVSGFELYAYCLMGNHAHMLIRVLNEDLDRIFRRLGASYVFWYNRKYGRTGHLFQDRYKSEVIENDRYFVAVLRYIHRNPIKAGMCKTPDEYKWSSYSEYVHGQSLVDCEYALSIIGDSGFITLMNEQDDVECLEYRDERKRLSDGDVANEIERLLNVKAVMLQCEPPEKRNQLLTKALEIDGVTTRQLSRVTGVSENIIWKL